VRLAVHRHGGARIAHIRALDADAAPPAASTMVPMTTASAPGLDAAAFGRKAAALLSARSDHLPRVLDVSSLGEHRELVLEPIAGPSLAALLAHRRRVTAGEAVTVVIGAVRAVAALHDAGYCVVDLGDDGIRFDVDGRPVVIGLDGVRETIQAGAAAQGDDWRAVAALADRLGIIAHGRSGGALGPAQLGLGLALAAVAAQGGAAVEGLEDALFEVAEPSAVRLSAADAAAADGQAGLAPGAQRRRAKASHRRPSGSRVIEAFEAGPAALLAGPRERVRALAGDAAARLSGRARLLVLGGAVAALLTVVAVLLLPAGGGAQSGTPQPRRAAPASTSPTAAAGEARPSSERASAAAPDRGAALTEPDPVAAATVLLTERDACLDVAAAGRGACLGRVADGAASALDEPARPLAGLAPSLLERTGDTALIALTPSDAKTRPASALLMRTEAGWRLRQLYEN